MKRKYLNPTIEMTRFELSEDILTSSPLNPNPSEGGDSGEDDL